MRRLLTLVVLSVLASPLAGRADGSIQIVAGAGVAKPFGDVANGAKMADAVDWAFPLDGQLQFRVMKQLAVGGYVRYAPTSVPSVCSGCTVNDLAFGGRVEYRFSERLEGGGWLGAFAGYEQLKSESPSVAASTKTTRTLSGVEGGLAAGGDFELGGLTLGPYVQLTVGEYTKQSGAGVSSTIASKGVHAFFGGGIRLTLLL
jgi:hypothetical protein